MILNRLTEITGSSERQLINFSKTASYRYKRYEIPKRTGGLRVIYQPSKELKALQRLLTRVFLHKLPIHNAATAYRENKGIRENAIVHLNNQYLLRMDFENFFPSIKVGTVKNLVCDYLTAQEDTNFLSSIVCRFGSLTIGAPTSPIVSNAALFEFDRSIFDYSRAQQIAYTRYADDMFFSCNTPNVLQGIPNLVLRTIEDLIPELNINHDKTLFTSKKRCRAVTGIILTSDNKISVGRKRKRYVKSMINKFLLNQLNLEQIEKLMGDLAYICSIETDFMQKMNAKFGSELRSRLNIAKLQIRTSREMHTHYF